MKKEKRFKLQIFLKNLNLSQVYTNNCKHILYFKNRELQDVMGLIASAQTNKQKSSSASKGKGKAKGKTLKDKNLKQLFEVNNKMRDLTRRLTLMQKSRHEPK